MSEQITPNPSVPSQVVQEVKFPQFVNNLGIIPTSYKNSMSYYETLAWFCKYLEETVIPTLNQNGDAVEELQGLYIELNSYVTNYFDNLDVQEEIDKKLDNLVLDGTISRLIKPYLDDEIIPLINEQNATIATQNRTISELSSRMSEFTSLPEGSTSGDAELADIRVDYLGFTYESAGDAVRTQTKVNGEKIDDLMKSLGQYVEVAGGTKHNNAFIENYTYQPREYNGYNYTSYTVEPLTEYYVFFKNNASGLVPIMITDSSDVRLKTIMAGQTVDYSETPYTLITPEDSHTLYVSSMNTRVAEACVIKAKNTQISNVINYAVTDEENYYPTIKDFVKNVSVPIPTDSEVTTGAFINRHTGLPENYPNYSYAELTVQPNEKYALKFALNGDPSPCGICLKDSSDNVIETKFAGATVDYSQNYYEYSIPSDAGSNAVLYLSSRLTVPTIFAYEPDSATYLKVVENPNYDLQQKIINNSIINQEIGYIKGGACIFTCDDGLSTDYDYIFPLVTTHNIPFVFGIWNTSQILTYHLNDLLDLISNYNCEVAQHYFASMNGNSINRNYEILNAQKTALNAMELYPKNFIYPYNENDENLQIAASGFYHYACGGGYKVNKTQAKKLDLSRLWVNSSLNYESAINNAIANNGLVIFGVHSSELSDSSTMQKMTDTINYAKNSGINIVNFEGIKNL